MLGANIYPVPAVVYENPAKYNHQARDFAKDIPNAIWTDQFDSTTNTNAHYESTGPEIWEQTKGEVDRWSDFTKSCSQLRIMAQHFPSPPSVCIYCGHYNPGTIPVPWAFVAQKCLHFGPNIAGTAPI
ncbi:hypothetical protein EV359DRAFT_85068 [Lentinula novae-zelandiae]|nr:hypothetical protein EV359DRAFT_85068 [Lentinula novae-zelandiae]